MVIFSQSGICNSKRLYSNPVGPAGRMVGPNLDEVTATCTPNMIGGSLPGWVLEPPVDLMNIQCRRCDVLMSENVSFLLFQN